LLACLPLELRLRAKSTTMSHRTQIYYADISAREGDMLEEAIVEAREIHDRRLKTGYDQDALDAAGRLGFSNGAFEDSEEEIPEIVEEFFPGADGSNSDSNVTDATAVKAKPSLKDKLDRKAVSLGDEST
jgi:hypothetical protein